MTGATKPGPVRLCLADRLPRTLATTAAVLQVMFQVEVQPLFYVLKGTASKLVLVLLVQGDSWVASGGQFFMGLTQTNASTMPIHRNLS